MDQKRSSIRGSYKPDNNLEINQHSLRIRQLMRADLNMLEEQNALLKIKCKQIEELQQKIDLILKHNAQLLTENQNLSKLANQRKLQLQTLKHKFDSQIYQKLGESVNRQFEMKRLISQIDRLNLDIDQIEKIKNDQIANLNNKYQNQIQTIKMNNLNANSMYEGEIRKMRQIIDKKQHQMNDILSQTKRRASEAQYDLHRLKDQKQKLKQLLQHQQWEKNHSIQNIKHQLEQSYTQQIQKIRKNQIVNIQSKQIQKIRIRDELDKKNIQIQEINNKFAKQKTYYDEQVALLRRQNQNYKNKILDIQKINQKEFQALKTNLGQVHEAQIQQVKLSNNKYLDSLQKQISKLQNHVKNKFQEIQQLVKEKASMRQLFQTQKNRLENQIIDASKKLKVQDANHSSIVHSLQQKITQKDKQIQYLNKINQDQQANSIQQVQIIKKLYQKIKLQLQTSTTNFNQRQQLLKNSLAELQASYSTFKESKKKQKIQKQRQIQKLKLQFQNQNLAEKSKIQALNSKCNMLERQNQSFKQGLQLKQKQIKLLKSKTSNGNDRQKNLQKQNEGLRNKLNKKDKQMTQMLNDQKNRLQSSFDYSINNLKNDHQSILKLEKNKYNDVIKKLNQKQKQIDSLMKMYKKMVEQIQILTSQQANQKELTIKFPGATADLLATKNLFDVFLKTKVLDYCQNQLEQKENRKL